MIYGDAASISAVARQLLAEKKDNDALELRGIFFDGEIYSGEDGVKKVSTLPTREEAIGNLVGLILGPGSAFGRRMPSRALAGCWARC